MYHKVFILFLLLMSSIEWVHSQIDSTHYIRAFYSQKYNNSLLENDSVFRQNQITLLDSLSNFMIYGEISPKELQLVFHIIQSPGMPNITDEDIFEQISKLNRDFNTTNARLIEFGDTLTHYSQRARNPYISFCLPDTSITPNHIWPILRVVSDISEWGLEDSLKFNSSGGSNTILPDSFINIWIVNLPDSLAGYAQFPGGPQNSDGIVINHSYLALTANSSRPFNDGKSLTHLMGTYLGVFELWNESNPCFDDYLFDTPIHNAPNIGFKIEEKHRSTCLGKEYEMTINFMDNTPDSNSIMFTQGQVALIHSSLKEFGFRNGLVSSQLPCLTIDSDLISPFISNTNNQSNIFFELNPNPTTGIVEYVIRSENISGTEINIFDANGKLLFTNHLVTKSSNYAGQLDLSNFSPGVYLVNVICGKFSATKSVSLIK